MEAAIVDFRPALMLEPASDWTGQTYEARLRASVAALFVHSLITPADHRRIVNRLDRRVEQARAERATGVSA